MWKKQKNLCASVERKAKKEHFDNIDLRNVTLNHYLEIMEWIIIKQFLWKMMKSYQKTNK